MDLSYFHNFHLPIIFIMVAVRTYHFLFWIFFGNKPGGVVYISYYKAQNVLLHLARYRPSNFGIFTGILMHIIQHICHSPIAQQKYLWEALQDVRFQEVMNDYGMFFLHDLDLDHHCIHEILTGDPYDCKIAMSFKGQVPKPLTVAQTPNSQPPLGDTPAWPEVKAFIGWGANVFMNEWVWDPEWDEENPMAVQLFVQFTREYFATLKLDAL